MGNMCSGPRGSSRSLAGVGGNQSTAVYYERYKQDRKQLGEGRAGHVFRCTERMTSHVYACKNISKSTQSVIECRREVMILNKLKGSQHIIYLKDVFEDSRNLFLVTELCTGGELYDQIVDRSQTEEGRFSEAETALMMKQILGAVEACHVQHCVTHRDLKPENFLLVNKNDISQIRMIDFGLSRFFARGERLKTRVGTVYYTAPEVWNENYDQSCDLWSAGVIMYVLLCSYPPFDGDSDKDILRSVCRGKYSFPSPEWDDISPGARNLIRKLLSKNPKRRPSATEALNDDWLKEYGGEESEEEEEEEESGSEEEDEGSGSSEEGEEDEAQVLAQGGGRGSYKGVELSPNRAFMTSAASAGALEDIEALARLSTAGVGRDSPDDVILEMNDDVSQPPSASDQEALDYAEMMRQAKSKQEAAERAKEAKVKAAARAAEARKRAAAASAAAATAAAAASEASSTGRSNSSGAKSSHRRESAQKSARPEEVPSTGRKTSGPANDDDEDGGWAAPVTGIARAGSAMLGLS